jgi:large subunit ribosomal protein L33
MTRKDGKRVTVTLRSTEGTGSTYTTTKNRTSQRQRMELRKCDPVLRRIALFRETR